MGRRRGGERGGVGRLRGLGPFGGLACLAGALLSAAFLQWHNDMSITDVQSPYSSPPSPQDMKYIYLLVYYKPKDGRRLLKMPEMLIQIKLYQISSPFGCKQKPEVTFLRANQHLQLLTCFEP